MRWSILISHTQDQEVQDERIDYLRVLIDEAWPASELIKFTDKMIHKAAHHVGPRQYIPTPNE